MISPIEEIKNKLNIVDVIGEYVKLQKAGRNWRGLCPFHKEKTPSFFVSEDKQLWHCFGCGRGGNIFDFIMQIENVDFKEALQILAQEAGVELKEVSLKEKSQKEKILKINEAALSFFENNLFLNKAKDVLSYLKKRGLSEKTIKEFRLGFAFDKWHDLEEFLKEKGFTQQDINAAGLLAEKNGKFFDRFRGRIMFPFFDLSGRVVGFSGRIFGQEKAGVGKYVNTPETIVFNKGYLVYGLNKAKDYIKKYDKVLAVEGQMDFLVAWEKGIKFAVATSGTAFTLSQLKILSRYSKNLYLSFDMDEAGQIATERIVPQTLSLDFKVKIISLPKGKDLADFLLKASKEEIKKIFQDSKEIMEFYFQRALSLADKNTLEGKKQIAEFFLKKIKPLKSPIEQGHWIERLSEALKIKEDYLVSLLAQLKPEREFVQYEDAASFEVQLKDSFFIPQNRWEKLGEKILSLILIDPKKFLPLFEKEIEKKSFLPEKVSLLINYLTDKKKVKNKEEKEKIKEYLGILELKNDYTLLSKEKDFDFEKELKDSIFQLKKEYFKEQLEILNVELKIAENKNDKKSVEEILKKINRLLKESKKYAK